MASRLMRAAVTAGIVVASLALSSGPTGKGVPERVSERLITVKAVLSGGLVRQAEQGQRVGAGEALAVVQTRFGPSVAARSPVPGTVVSVKQDVGHAVAVGETLFVVRR